MYISRQTPRCCVRLRSLCGSRHPYVCLITCQTISKIISMPELSVVSRGSFASINTFIRTWYVCAYSSSLPCISCVRRRSHPDARSHRLVPPPGRDGKTRTFFPSLQLKKARTYVRLYISTNQPLNRFVSHASEFWPK